VHVFWGTTDPLSVMHAPADSIPVAQLDESVVLFTQLPPLHCSVSLHVFCA
jgi:hypothetical protein